jgi:benzoate-CoA ligase
MGLDRGAQGAGRYNAAVDLLERNLAARPDKVAFIDAGGEHTYLDLAERAVRLGAVLIDLGLEPGDRVVLLLQDGFDFVVCFLGAIRVGLVPIPLNTLLTAEDYAYVLADSGASAVLVSDSVAPTLATAIAVAAWPGACVVADGPAGRLADLVTRPARVCPAFNSGEDDVAFWLYSSGSTGRPKGSLHRHRSLVSTADLFARRTLGLGEADVVFSAAKLFFAYGLGNALTFPICVGATCVLFPGRVTPQVVEDILLGHAVTVFCGVPTLFAAMLASPHTGRLGGSALRLCTSAGEALPAPIGHAWTQATGVEIIDGIGSTEMLHVFLSNRPGAVRYGATGLPVPGYEVKLVGDDGLEVGAGEVGELYVRGPSMTAGYWNQPERTASTFVDGWMRSGDKFEVDEAGCFVHRGRTDDMLKVSGIWVSPTEVEAALMDHEAVLEAAVIGVTDAAGLTRTKAFVVPKPGVSRDSSLGEALKAFVKARLAPHKYPRLIEIVDGLPKTATGKIRRHVLREREAAQAASGGAR